MPHKFENLCHSDLVRFMYLDPVSKHICVRYEGFIINHISKSANCSEKKKWLAILKNCVSY